MKRKNPPKPSTRRVQGLPDKQALVAFLREAGEAEKADIAKADADIKNWQAQIKLADAEFARVDQAFKNTVASKTDLDKAVATWVAFAYLAADTDVDFRAISKGPPTGK